VNFTFLLSGYETFKRVIPGVPMVRDIMLTRNLQKNKETVFIRPRVSHFHMPSAVDDIEQLNCVKLLGVLHHIVHFLISQCSQRMISPKAVALLQHQGIPSNKLRVAAYSLIVSRIVYVLPAWGGFISAELIGKVDAMFRRFQRFGYVSDNLNVSDLIQNADEDLFHKMRVRQHCLHHLLRPVRVMDKLRERGHPFILPEYNTVIHNQSINQSINQNRIS